MLLPQGATIAVADGETVRLFHNGGDGITPQLHALPHPEIIGAASDAGERHHGGSANPSYRQLREDGFAAATAAFLNKQVLDGKVQALVIIAAPKTLGELRQHYHKALTAKLIGEIGKELTGHSTDDILKAIAAA